MPCSATFMSNGLATPPCGAPSLVGAKAPSSITPAFQPLAHQAPCGEGAQRREYVIVAEPVERRLEVGVERPQPFREFAARDGVDGHDGVVAAPARPESVGLRLEPGLPLGF